MSKENIFSSKTSAYIPIEKCLRLDIYKTWNGIFIKYTETIKHIIVWALYTYHILVTSKPVLNKSNKRSQLLIEHLIPLMEKSFHKPADDPRL